MFAKSKGGDREEYRERVREREGKRWRVRKKGRERERERSTKVGGGSINRSPNRGRVGLKLDELL